MTVKNFTLTTLLGESNFTAEIWVQESNFGFKNNEEMKCRFIQIIRFLDTGEELDTVELEYIQKTLNTQDASLLSLKNIATQKLKDLNY